MAVVRIPISGYGMGNREYGECLFDAFTTMKVGVDYIARLEPAEKPKDFDDWDEEDQTDWPQDAVDLVLRPKE